MVSKVDGSLALSLPLNLTGGLWYNTENLEKTEEMQKGFGTHDAFA